MSDKIVAMCNIDMFPNMQEYIKDFDKWNDIQKTIDSRDRSIEVFFREQEIWWCSLGINIGSEIDGKNETFERPVLIVKKVRF